MGDVIVEATGVSKSFPGVLALDNVHLEVSQGEIVGLVGENGAGKSTLCKILAGLYPPDSGTIKLRGAGVRFRNVREAADAGIGMVFQEQSLLPNISVAENIYLGQEHRFSRGGVINWQRLRKAAQRQLDKIGAKVDTRAYTASLSFAERQMVELAKVLTVEERIQGAPVVILDEPTSVLDKAEIDRLFETVHRLKVRCSVVFISHRLDEVLAISDRIYVLRDGRNVTSLRTAETSVAELHKLMVGRERKSEYYKESRQREPEEDPVLEARGLVRNGVFAEIDLRVRRGEIVGLAGVVGSGKEELARALFGVGEPPRGEIQLRGRPVRLKSPIDARRLGIGYLPRDRKIEGIIEYLSVPPNVTLANIRQCLSRGFLSSLRESRLVSGWVQRLGIKCPSLNALCRNLSGGNQQKVVLAKWLSSNVSIMIMDHPTRGLDVGAKEEVYELVRGLAEQGMSVVLTSDTLEELIGLSNTILVMKDGRIRAQFDCPPGAKPSEIELIRHMV